MTNRSLLLSAAILGGMAAAAIFVLLSPSDISIAWVTAMHEGTTFENIERVHGTGAHAGPLFRWIVDAAHTGHTPDLRNVLRLNLALCAAAAVFAFALARAVLGSWWLAAPWLLLWAVSPLLRHVAVSELPSALLLLLGLFATALIDPAASSNARRRSPALAGLAVLAAASALLRVETLFVYAPVILTAILRARLGAEALDAHLRQATRATWTWLRGPAWRALLVLVALGLSFKSLDLLGARPRWIAAGLHPFYPTLLTLPAHLVWFIPAPLVALVVLGSARSVVRVGATLGAGLAVFALYRVYFEASHGVLYEMFRYLTYLTPALAALSLYAWAPLARFSRPALVVLGALLFLPPPHGAVYEPPDLLDQDLQREVRFLLAQRDANPDCVIVSRVTRNLEGDRRAGPWNYAVFGAGTPHVISTPVRDRAPLAAADDAVPGAGCVLYYRGLDCNLAAAPLACDGDTSAAPPIATESFSARPYNDDYERGATTSEVELALYRLR